MTVLPQAVAKALASRAVLAAMSEGAQQGDLSDDLLEGAAAIAKFVFGNDTHKTRRRVYHLADLKRRDRLPVFRMGQQIFARKSTLLRWIAERECGDEK